MTATWSWAGLGTVIADGLSVGPGCRVAVTTTGPGADEAVAAFVREVYRRGASAQVILADTRYDEYALADAADEVLAEPPPLQLAALRWSDVLAAFRPMTAPTPPGTGRPDPARLARQRQALGQVSRERWGQRGWIIVRVPTPGWARAAGMSYEVLAEQFQAGAMADWAACRRGWADLAGRLAAAGDVRVQAPGTDLSLSAAGRRWVPFAGEHNIPDGELATAPVDDSAAGHITFPGPFWFAGTRFAGLRLHFEGGRVTDVAADQGADVAAAIIGSDDGASRVGELGIGLNPHLTAWTGDLFFDEKILGTVHLALGRAYPECGGVNDSAIHWDIVLDLREPGGFLRVGNQALIADGVPQPPLAGPAASGAP